MKIDREDVAHATKEDKVHLYFTCINYIKLFLKRQLLKGYGLTKLNVTTIDLSSHLFSQTKADVITWALFIEPMRTEQPW